MLVELGLVEQRYKAVQEVLDGATVTDVARRNGVARQTVHDWLRRYATNGLAGLIDKSSKPDRSPLQMSPSVEAAIVEMRRKHPGWGPRTIAYQLAVAGIDPLPGRTSIYRCLVRHRLIEPAPRRRRRQDFKRWERSRAVELWQMDIVGRGSSSPTAPSSPVSPGSTTTPASASRPASCQGQRRTRCCEALRFTLRAHGLPSAILSDNGKVFTARFGRGPGPVLFDRICADNGIRHLLTAPYSPTTTGKVERFHKTMRAEFLSEHDRRYSSIEEIQDALDHWVEHYTTIRPHQSVGMHPPVERFQLARSVDPDPELIEVDEEIQNEASPPAGITRRVGLDGRVHLAGFAYGVGRWLTGEVVEMVLEAGLARSPTGACSSPPTRSATKREGETSPPTSRGYGLPASLPS